jgi:hypothetical protein
MQVESKYAEAARNRGHEGEKVVAAAGLRSRGWHVRALISCAALTAAVVLAPAALGSGLVPDPDPGPDPAQPQPDAYQSTQATTTTAAAAATTAPAPASAAPETPAPLLPTVHISQPRPTTPVRATPPKIQVRPSVVATPTHVSEAATEAPAPRSTPSPPATHIVVPAVVATHHAKPKHSVRAHFAQARLEVAHHARATAPPTPTIRFARAAIDLRWPFRFAPAVEIARPRQVSPGVALAVAAVVLLSGSFLAVAARQVRQQVGP